MSEIPPFKSHCDHCGVLVDKKSWTFDLEQCVVCAGQECKIKQRKILDQAISDAGDAWIRSRELEI